MKLFKKRIVSLLLALVMLAGLMPMKALAADTTEAAETTEAAVVTETVADAEVTETTGNDDLMHIICYGQSFSVGADAPGYADPIVDGTYVLGSITSSTVGDILLPLQMTSGTQHPIVTAVNSLSQMLAADGIDVDIIAGSYGSGGKTIAQLMSAERQAQIKAEEGYAYDILSSGKYTVFQNSVAAVADYAAANGKSVSCPVIVFLQGETDQNTDAQLGYPENPVRAGYGAGGDKEKYKEYMARLKEDMQREVMEAYRQTEKPLFLIYQVSGTYVRTQYSSINMAQLEFAQENDDVILVQTPYFAPHYTNSHHLTVNGYRWLGEYIGQSMYTALTKQVKAWPILPQKFTVEDANTLRITVTGAVNGLTIDTWTVEDATNSSNRYGFYFTVNGSTVVPQTVTVNENDIILTVPDGTVPLNKAESVYIYYGGQRAKGTGNIRDNCAKTGFYCYLDDRNDTGTGNNQGVSHSALDEYGNSLIGQPYSLYNWLASFCYEIEIPDAEQKQAAFYHWEMQEAGLVSVSEDQNDLTLLQGSVENGVLTDVQYRMKETVVLYHNRPWAIEWKAAGNGSSYGGGMLLAAADGSGSKAGALYLPADSRGLVAWNVSGEGRNYGIKLGTQGIDTREEHTYRIENRIAADGTNTVYLIVDGVEIGAMNTSYSTSNGSLNDDITNWANGANIYLSYMGRPANFLLKNMKLLYLKVWEAGQHTHTYENGICTICGAEAPNPYAGKTIACVGDSITCGVGVTAGETDYVTLLAKSLDMEYIRLGASGTTLCTDGSRTCNITRLTEGHLAGADVVTIAMGINDFCAAAEGYYELGDINSTDSSTIYGAVRMWCERIEELRKTESLSNTQFYFVTPVICSWNNSVTNKRDWDQSKTNIHGYTLRDLCNAIMEVAALYDVAVIDLNLLSGMYYIDETDNNTAVFGGDGVHPGETGHRMMAAALENALLQNNLKNDHEHVYGSWITTTYPDCEAGEQQRVCSVCSATESRQLDALGHTYENGICTICGATVSPYLQQLPENIIGCTNLYDSLIPMKGYYTATKYDTSNGAVLSVVIPVEPGDRIAASSFGPVSENMGSVNGIRVTYLLGDKIVTSLSPGEVYGGYTNNGYITVPDGVDAVCVPWWAPSDRNWLTLGQISKDFVVHSPKAVSAQLPTCTENGYTAGEICEICNASLGDREVIPPTGHSYSGDTCTVCGTVNRLAFLDGKYVSVLGDSISTFNGYSNDAAVNTTIGGNGPRYDVGTADTKPGSYCLLESVDDTWWMHFANRSGMKLLVNNSWAGSQVFGGKTSDGRVIPAAYLDRCVNLHDNTLENNPGNAPIHPDVIFVYLGINDYNFNRSKVGTGAVDYSSLVSGDETYVTPATFGEAYGIMLHKMRRAYPDAQIFAMTLLPENLYSVDKTAWEQHNTYIRAAAEYYDIPLVDLAENCAITWENYSGYMIDKIHPTTAGMKLISDCIEAELAAYYEENLPHIHSYEAVVTEPTCTERGYTTYTCACGESYVDDYVDALGHTYENGICTGCGAAEWDSNGDGVLEILAIGNSFSWDAVDFWYDMQESMTYDAMKRMLAEPYDVHLAVMYKGSATLSYHATCAMNNTAAYTYTEIGPETNYKWTPASGKNATNSILTHLEEREWDIIVIQSYQHEADGTDPRSTYTGGDSRFVKPEASVGYLLDYFAEHEPNAEVYYYMPWASTKFYGDDTAAGYQAIAEYTKNCVPNLAGTNSGKQFAGIIPVGTGIQNARTTYFDALQFNSGTGSTELLRDPQNGLQYDTQHLSFGVGRYIAGLVMAETLIPQEMRVDSYTLPDVKDSPAVGALPQEYSAIAQLAARNAVAYPYQLTVLSGYETDLADRICKAIETGNYVTEEIADEAVLLEYVQTVVDACLENAGAAKAEITLHSFVLENDKIKELDASVALRVGYTNRTAQIDVVDGRSHRFGDWNHVTVPTANGVGIDSRTCTVCGFTQIKEVEGSWQKYNLGEHLQELPEKFCCETNLWSELVPEAFMIDHLGNWVSAGPTVYSVTIPINPGDKIYANSFGITESRKGIQVSFIGVYGIVKTTFSSGTYKEFQENGGYLIAPEGAIAVNIPVWNVNADNNIISILNAEHIYDANVTPPACTEQGYTTYTCVCGESYVDDYVDALGHTYENGICTECGEADPDHHTPGDINGDGDVNNKDLTRLFKHLSGYTAEVVERALDVNGDGSVNNKDLTRLFKYLSGWDVELA